MEADVLSIVGPIWAGAGSVDVSAQSVLQAGPISACGNEVTGGGRVSIDCQRYIGTSTSAITAASTEGTGGSIQITASVSAFSSGELKASGQVGGRIWVTGAKTQFVAARLDARGFVRGGSVCVGTESSYALPDARESLARPHPND